MKPFRTGQPVQIVLQQKREHRANVIVSADVSAEPSCLSAPLVMEMQRISTRRNTTMLMAIFAVLVVLWLLGFTLFNVASGLIHLLLIVAVIALVMHFVKGRRIA
jgi:hypothetical protein